MARRSQAGEDLYSLDVGETMTIAVFEARIVILLLAIFEVAVVWGMGIARERLGWKSATGNIIWGLVGCPGTVAIFFVQQL